MAEYVRYRNYHYSPRKSINTIEVSSDEEKVTENNYRRSFSISKGLPTNQSMAISLNDFDASYTHPKTRTNISKPATATSNESTNVFRDIGKSFIMKFKAIIIGCVIGLSIILMMGGDGTTSSDNDNYLKCSVIDKPQLCIEESHLEHVLYLAKEIQSHLETIAGSFTCDKGSKRNETIQDLILKYNASIKDLEKVFYFFLFNPHRGINTYRSNGDIISDHILGVTTSDVMESIKPKMTISCHLRQSLLKNTSLIYSLVGIVLIIIGIIVYNILQHQRMKKQATVYAMIDDIMEVLKAHHQKCQRNDGLLPYVAIVHVRDMLIPPSESFNKVMSLSKEEYLIDNYHGNVNIDVVREKKQKIWDEAVKMIAMNESRVRVETRRIAGEDFTVWNWIHVEPPPTEEPNEPNEPVSCGNSNAWKGRAFEDYSPGLESKVAPPLGKPSPCIRVKNMFEHVKHMAESQIKDIQNSIIERCINTGSMVHIYVDKRSSYGCVYFKMEKMESAVSAYKILHGSWFKGRLITAKYIPESKYYKWFPKAQFASVPLQISS